MIVDWARRDRRQRTVAKFQEVAQARCLRCNRVQMQSIRKPLRLHNVRTYIITGPGDAVCNSNEGLFNFTFFQNGDLSFTLFSIEQMCQNSIKGIVVLNIQLIGFVCVLSILQVTTINTLLQQHVIDNVRMLGRHFSSAQTAKPPKCQSPTISVKCRCRVHGRVSLVKSFHNL